jgi:hypothetical protein
VFLVLFGPPTLGYCANGGVVVVWKIVASWWRAARHLPNFANGAAGAGLWSASIKLIADLMTVSVDDSRGMGHCSGKNSTVSLICSDADFVA